MWLASLSFTILKNFGGNQSMKQAVIYARSASPNEDSIRTQIALGKKFAADNGYTVIKVFADTNASGRSADRPALQKLFEDISSSWDTVIVLNRSRFFREPYLYIKYMLKLNFAGKRIISCIERLSTTSYDRRKMQRNDPCGN